MIFEWKIEAYVSEFIGTFFLVFTVGLNVLQNTALAPVSIGSILMVMIFATGSVSGAHYNPAVTLGVFLSDRDQIHWANACIYAITQIAGGLCAGFMYYWVLGATFTLHPGQGYNAIDAGAVEVLFTAALVFVVLNVATTSQDTNNHYYGLAIGFTVMSAAFACGSISGCALNPAVTCGVMLSNLIHSGGGMTYFPLYTLCPMAGACLAVGLFRVIRAAEFSGKPAQYE